MPWTFLAPMYLAGALALAIPLYVHLRNRQVDSPIRFPTLKFLIESRLPSQRVRNLMRWLVLAGRLLALAALVAAFAQPMLSELLKPKGDSAVLALDVSCSMRTGGVWQAARREALTWLDRNGDANTAIVLMGRMPRVLAGFDVPAAKKRAMLDKLEPGYEATAAEAAVRLAGGMLESRPSAQRRLTIISDMAAPAWSQLDWTTPLGPGIKVQAVPVGPVTAANASVAGVTAPRTFWRPNVPLKLTATIANHAPAAREVDAVCKVGGEIVGTRHITLAPRSAQELAFEATPKSMEPLQGEISITASDDLLADNARYFVVPPRKQVRVGRITADQDAASDLFLRYATDPSADDLPRQFSWSALPADFDKPLRELADVIVIDQGMELGELQAKAMRQFVEAGGAALVLLGKTDQLAKWEREFLPIKLGGLGQFNPVDGPQHFAQVKMRHEILQQFAKPGCGDLFGVEVSKWRSFSAPAAETLIALANSEPALVVAQRGGGRLAILAFAPHRQWTDWPTRTTFLPVLHETFKWLCRFENAKAALVVGEMAKDKQTDQPGVVTGLDGAAVAVNVDPAESDLSRWTALGSFGRLENTQTVVEMGGPMAMPQNRDGSSVIWFMLAAAAVLSLAELVAGQSLHEVKAMDTSAFDDVRRPLLKARRMLRLGMFARVTAWAVVALLLAETTATIIACKIGPWAAQGLLDLLPGAPLLAAVMLLLGVVAAFLSYRQIERVAAEAQRRLPELGLGLSASLQAPLMAHCSPSIREALWQETHRSIGTSRWTSLTSPRLTWGSIVLVVAVLLAQLLLPALSVSWSSAIAAMPHSLSPAQMQPGQEASASFVRPTLELMEPAHDGWATANETVDVKARSKGSNGITNLRVKAQVNGDKEHEISLEPSQTPGGSIELRGQVAVDQLGVEEFDTVALSVCGDSTDESGKKIEVRSQLVFVQIRPVKLKLFEAYKGKAGVGVDWVSWLTEQQRARVRTTWNLDSTQALLAETDEYKQIAADAPVEQSELVVRAEELLPEIVRSSPKLRPLIEQAISYMNAADKPLQSHDWPCALTQQQLALATLVKAQKTDSASKKPGGTVIKFGPQYKAEMERQDNALRLLEAQVALNGRSPAVPLKDIGLNDLATQQDALVKRAGEVAKTTCGSGNLVLEAGEEMKLNGLALAKRYLGTDESLDHGPKAADLLRQAAILELAAADGDMAATLEELLRRVGEMDYNLSNSGEGLTKGELAKMTSELGEMAQTLAAMTPQAPSADDGSIGVNPGSGQGMKGQMSDAKEAMEKAAQQMQQGNPDSQALKDAMEKLAKAYRQAVGDKTHMAQLDKELTEITRELENVQRQLDRVQKWNKGRRGTPKQGGRSSEQSAEEDNPAEETQDQGADHAGESPRLQVEGEAPQPQDGQAENTGPSELLGTPNRMTISTPAQDLLDQLRRRSSALQAQLRAALGDQPSLEQMQNAFGQLPAKGETPGNNGGAGGQGVGGSGTGTPNNVTDLSIALGTVKQVHDELQQQLSQRAATDWLIDAQSEGMPDQYRELVGAYLEALSRRAAQEQPPQEK